MNRAALAFAFLALTASAAAQGFGPWTVDAASWKKPCLVAWQRSLADAEALSKASGKPMLLVVNMDGEPASEHYAGSRYRDPEFAKLTDRYVPLVMSVNRHSPRDYDDQGRRIPCPRFGRVTCGEHIDAEPEVFRRFLEGNRVAPRHLAIDVDGGKLFDCFLNGEPKPVLEAIRSHGKTTAAHAATGAIEARVASRDAADREAVEAAYLAGNTAARLALLQAAKQQIAADPLDLLRLGLRDKSPELYRAAAEALAATDSGAAVELVALAMRTAKGAERKLLFDALVRLSKGSARARTLAAVLRALDTPSTLVNVGSWTASVVGKSAPPLEDDADAAEKRIDDAVARRKKSPTDAQAPLDEARATLRFAELRMAAQKDPRFLIEDAQLAVEEAARRKAPAWSVAAVRLRVRWYRAWLGMDPAPAAPISGAPTIDPFLASVAADAEAAIVGVRADAVSAEASTALALFAQSRRAKILQAMTESKEWPAEWLSDAEAAYAVLAVHPLGTSAHAVEHVDLLNYLGAEDRAAHALDDALARFHDDAPLHDRFVSRALAAGGVDALDAAYAALLKKRADSAALDWFAGKAAVVAAEFRRRAGDLAGSRGSYTRAIELLDRSAEREPNYRDSAGHYACLALAGRGRIALEAKEYETAVADLVAAAERRPESLDSDDGLQRTPRETLGALRAILDVTEQFELRQRLEDLLAKIDPELATRPASRPAQR